MLFSSPPFHSLLRMLSRCRLWLFDSLQSWLRLVIAYRPAALFVEVSEVKLSKQKWTENVSVSTWHPLLSCSARSICHCLRLFEKRHNIATRLTGSRQFCSDWMIGAQPAHQSRSLVRDIPAVNIRWFNATLPSLSVIRPGGSAQTLTAWPPESCLGPRCGSNHSTRLSDHFQYKWGQLTAKAAPEWKETSNGQSRLSFIVAFSCSRDFVPPKRTGVLYPELCDNHLRLRFAPSSLWNAQLLQG